MDDFLSDKDADEVIDLGDTPGDSREEDVHEADLDQLDDEQSDGAEDSDEFTADREAPDDATAIYVFKDHKQPVLRICLSKLSNFAVSGGQDDMAHVWETTTGRLLFSCPNHKDSVHCVGVSCKETFVVTADMSGLVQVFKVPSGEKMFDYELDDVHWVQWHPLVNAVLVVGTESGSIWVFNVLDVNKIKTLQGSAAATTIAKITSCGTKLMAGYEDGSVRLWDLKDSSILFAIKDNLAHKSAVTCIDFQGEDEAISATGSTDGTVKLINLCSGKVLTSFACGVSAGGKAAHQSDAAMEGHDAEETGDEANSIETVAFCSVLQLLATATVRGVIEVWEVSSFRRRCNFVHEEGVSGIRWDLTDHTKVHSAGLDGYFNTWDGRDGKLLMQRLCHTDHILDFDVKRGDEDDIVATASEDATCRVFHLNKY